MSTLFDAGPRLKTVDLRDPHTGASGWYATKCLDCGNWVSKFDFTAEESRECSLFHRCEEEA